MGITSFKPVTHIVDKANSLVNKVTGSNLFNKVFGTASQVLRRFPTPQDVANIPDPLKDTQWEIVFPTVNIKLKEGNSVAIPYQPIVEDISFTFPEVFTTNLKFGPRSYTAPIGKTSNTTFSATFYCDNSATIINYYDTWRKEVVKDDFMVGLSDDFKKRAYIYLLGIRSVMPVYLIKFKGIYPTKISGTTLRSDNKAKRITYTITFSVDEITCEPVAAGQVVTGVTNNLVGNLLGQFGSVSSITSHFL